MPKSEGNAVDLSAAMQHADAADQVAKDLTDAVREGIAAPAKTFNTHSQAFAGRMIAEANSLKETVADLDEKIAKLNEERTDAMLAYSGVNAALAALERGR